jgi:hypothetical protein
MLIYLQQMAARFNRDKFPGVRLGHWLSLIFFAWLSVSSCNYVYNDAEDNNSNDGNAANGNLNQRSSRDNKSGDIDLQNGEERVVYADEKVDIAFVYLNEKAKSLAIPFSSLPGWTGDLASNAMGKLKPLVNIVLKSTADNINPSGISMLGNFGVIDKNIVFTPVVPFTPGKTYLVFYESRLLREVRVPLPEASLAPLVTAVYPTIDTLPENVLKLYVFFSTPMREGEAINHIKLISQNNDTLDDTFLNLQPELWNKESNVLTIWFDPGRIKRDLIPNLKKGNPLAEGQKYSLFIDSTWASANGLALQKPFRKRLFISTRDSISPRPEQWRYSRPVAGTHDPMKVSFPESMDYFLLQKVFTIFDGKSRPVAGSFVVKDNEKAIEFIPTEKWQPGKFRLRTASILEDLAGNNLNRPFERDNLRNEATTDKLYFEIPFTVQPVVPGSNPSPL